MQRNFMLVTLFVEFTETGCISFFFFKLYLNAISECTPYGLFFCATTLYKLNFRARPGQWLLIEGDCLL